MFFNEKNFRLCLRAETGWCLKNLLKQTRYIYLNKARISESSFYWYSRYEMCLCQPCVCKLHIKRWDIAFLFVAPLNVSYHDKSSTPVTLLIQWWAFKSASTTRMDPHLALQFFTVRVRRFLCTIGPLYPVRTSARTQRPLVELDDDGVNHPLFLFPGCFPRLVFLALCYLLSLLLSSSLLVLLRVRCFDRCGLVGRMVRWLVGWLNDLARIRWPRPYRSPPSVSFLAFLTGPIPINTLCVYTAVSFRYILTPRLVIPAGRTQSAHLLHPGICLVDGRLANRSFSWRSA